MKKVRLFRCCLVASGLVALLMIFVFIMSIVESSAPTVRFVLPTAYRGPFVLVIDPAEGIEPRLEDEVFIYEIPRSGILKVNEDHLLLRWHQEEAMYHDGQIIPLYEEQLAIPEAITFHGLFNRKYDGKDADWWLIGTAAEMDQAFDNIYLKPGNRANGNP